MASNVNDRNTRNIDSFNVYTPNSNIEYNWTYFKYAGGKIWNGIPYNIQNAPSVEAFKFMLIRNLLLNRWTLTEGSNILYERFCIILICMVYFC